MACEETKCTDNLVLPQGPQGERGPTGVTGPQGPTGASQIGPTGPAGGSKIDINLQSGNDPYIELTSAGTYQTLAHFIFPGTTTFTPDSWRFAIGGYAPTGQNIITTRLGYISPSGIKTVVATKTTNIDPSQSLKYLIEEVTSLSGFPTTAYNFYIEAKANYTASPTRNFITRFFAMELRA